MKCKKCNLENLSVIDHQPLDTSSDDEHIYLDCEIYADIKCHDCGEVFDAIGKIEWEIL